MSQTTSEEMALTPEQRALIDQDSLLHEQFVQALMEDEQLAAEIPRGAVLVLIPDQLPNLAEANLRTAIAAAKRGRNVYIRHVYRQPGQSGHYGVERYGPSPPEPASSEPNTRRVAEETR